jgi:adenosylcobinamide kinase / adenosylcobinamide-phosphate guanylyltransferase
MAESLGGDRVLYVATAETSNGDVELERRVGEHRKRRPAGWRTVEIGGAELGAILRAARGWDAVLVDSLTLWVSARVLATEDDESTLEQFGRFLEGVQALPMPCVLVSDETGLGVVPESAAGRRFRDLLGLANQRAAAAAEEVHLCVAGIGVRIK